LQKSNKERKITMLGQKKDSKKVLSVTMVILGIALVYSLVSTVFASSNNNEVASLKTMSTAIISGSENVPLISIKDFLQNTVENTGINAIVNGKE